jgi:hypothetical protein
MLFVEKLLLFAAGIILVVLVVNRLQERDKEDFEKGDN